MVQNYRRYIKRQPLNAVACTGPSLTSRGDETTQDSPALWYCSYCSQGFLRLGLDSGMEYGLGIGLAISL